MPSSRVAVASSPLDEHDAMSPAPTRVTVLPVTVMIAVPAIAAETVFVPATVELKVPVATPVASVGPPGCASVFPLPVAASTTVAPLIGLPLASFAVTVIVDVPLPVAIDGGVAVTVDCAADTEPAVTVIVAVCVTAIPS